MKVEVNIRRIIFTLACHDSHSSRPNACETDLHTQTVKTQDSAASLLISKASSISHRIYTSFCGTYLRRKTEGQYTSNDSPRHSRVEERPFDQEIKRSRRRVGTTRVPLSENKQNRGLGNVCGSVGATAGCYPSRPWFLFVFITNCVSVCLDRARNGG
ncbi:hypothetical protein Bbelb_169260 [Branchiostoma belcheri]|nr:hypothetical protein Bbelb_169260 [Branchiostoma belcheri]